MSRNYSSTAVQTALAAPLTAADTAVAVSSTAGFPAPPYILALDLGASAQELVLVTGASGTNLTVTRGYDSTTAQSHDTGAVVAHVHAAIDLREARAHEGATIDVHGTSGALVGTSGAQTFTSKTLSAADNTINGLPVSSFVVTDDTGKLDPIAGVKAVPTGIVVGDSDTQTLTNKTLTSPAVNNPTVKEETITNDAVTDVPSTVNAIAGTTADLQRWQVNGVDMARLHPDGSLGSRHLTGSPSVAMRPMAAMAATVAQAIPHNTHTNLDLDASVVDTAGLVDLANNRFLPSEGLWKVTINVGWGGSTAGSRRIVVQEFDGTTTTTIREIQSPGGQVNVVWTHSYAFLYNCTGAVDLQFQVWQNSGASLSTATFAPHPYTAEVSIEFCGKTS